MDLLISYSIFETFGLTIAEALTNGLRVIYTENTGIDDFIFDDYSIKIERNNIELKNALLKLINEESYSWTLSKLKIRTQYKNVFCSETVRASIIKFYSECLNNRRLTL
jgi:hypothetical protein